jgi:Fe-S cluster biogenesis protein NfuA
MDNHKEAVNLYKQSKYLEAFELWKTEAEQNNNDQSMTNIGLLYLKGEGVEKNFDLAREWFEKASEYNNSSAFYNLALIYQTRIGVEENFPKAIDYFRKAIKTGHTKAIFRLATLLLKDRTDMNNVKEGFDLMLESAKRNNPLAITQLGGFNTDEDVVKEKTPLNNEFRSKTKAEQLNILLDILDRHVRPVLIKDGGNILLVDYLSEPEIEIRLAYQGNCAGCSLSTTGTFDMIKNIIYDLIDNNVKIYVL